MAVAGIAQAAVGFVFGGGHGAQINVAAAGNQAGVAAGEALLISAPSADAFGRFQMQQAV